MAQYNIIFKVNVNASGELFTERKLRLTRGQLLVGTDTHPSAVGPLVDGQFLMGDYSQANGLSTTDVFLVDFSENLSARINASEIDTNNTLPGKPFRVVLNDPSEDPYSLVYYNPSYDRGDEAQLGLRLNSSRNASPLKFYHRLHMDLATQTLYFGANHTGNEQDFEYGTWLIKGPDHHAWIMRNSTDERMISFENPHLNGLSLYAAQSSPVGSGLSNGDNPIQGSVLFTGDKMYVKKGTGAGDWNSVPVPDMSGHFDLNGVTCQMDTSVSTSAIFKTQASRLWVAGGNNEDNLVAVMRLKGSELVEKDAIGHYVFVPKGLTTPASAYITAIASANHAAGSNPTALLFGQAKSGETGSLYNNQYRMMIAGDGRMVVKSAGINIFNSLPVARSGFDVHDSVGYGSTVQSASDITLGDAYCYMLSGAAAGRTFTLPSLADCEGRSYFVINATTGQTLTIARSGTDKANGGNPTITLATGDAVMIHATGNSQYGWFISANVKR